MEPTKEKTKLLVWCPRGAGGFYGGPGTNVLRLLEYGDGSISATLCHGNLRQTRQDAFEKEVFVAEMRHFSSIKQGIFVRKGCSWMKQHAREFDVVLGIEGFHPTVAPVYEAHKAGVPSVVFLAAHRTDLADKKGLSTLLGIPRKRRAMAAELDGLIALSSAMAEELREYGVPKDKIVRIPIGIDVDVFRPAASSAEKSQIRRDLKLNDRPTLIFVGGINRRKQPHLLALAVAEMKRRELDVQLLIVGPEQDPAYSEEIRAAVRQHDIEERVVWYGFTNEVAPLFRAADIYGLTSKNEGMPSALLEAMASGLPCITTAISGTTDVVVNGRSGAIVADDEAEVSRTLAAYLEDPAMRAEHGARARDFVADNLSLHRVYEAYRKLFELITNGGRASDASIVS